MVKRQRASGILLHISSLPGPYGIGDIGPEAYKFVDFLRECDQQIWQILPLNATEKVSPYSSVSAFAANPLLISFDKLVDDGLLTKMDIESTRPNFDEPRNLKKLSQWKHSILHHVYENYKTHHLEKFQSNIDAFIKREQYWLDHYTLYLAIRAEQNNRSWSEWPQKLKQCDKKTLESKRQQYAEFIHQQIFLQYIFFQQWYQLKEYANQNGVTILGDMPVYMDYDSADVWANQSLFQLDGETSLPIAVSGAPPDAFSDAGQTWNNPLYDWTGNLRKSKFDWWIKRLKKCLETVDIVRIDHFRGLESYWAIPISSDGKPVPAIEGEWVKACGDEFFTEVTKVLGDDLPIVVEDLGYLTQEVFDLRDKFGLVGMRILQFAFSHWPNDLYLPHNYVSNCIAYTGTHDNNTTIAWFRNDATKKEKEYVINYLQKEGDPERNINWDFIRLVMSSVADTAILLFQDVLDLGEGCRMNDPAFSPSFEDNWHWRFQWEQLKQSTKDKLKLFTYIYGRHLPKEALERPNTEAGVEKKN